MCGLAAGKVAEGTARLGAEAEKEGRRSSKHLLYKSDVFSLAVLKILCVSLGCDFGMVPLCAGQILFEMQEGGEEKGAFCCRQTRGLRLWWWKEEGHLSQPINASFHLILLREVNIYNGHNYVQYTTHISEFTLWYINRLCCCSMSWSCMWAIRKQKEATQPCVQPRCF